jgi:hypothetical protein
VSDVCDNNFLVTELRAPRAKKLLWGSNGRACPP